MTKVWVSLLAAVCALSLGLSLFWMVRPARTGPESAAAAPYILKDHGGRLAVFAAEGGEPCGQQLRGLPGRGGGLGAERVVAERDGRGREAPQGVPVVEGYTGREQPFAAFGRQLETYETRDACRVAFRCGEGFDAGREPCRIGRIGASEQGARRCVEQRRMPCDVPRAPAGDVHGLV